MIRAKGRSSSGRYMLTFSRRPYAGTDPRRSVSVLPHHPRPPRLRWMNFNICLHCRANGRPGERRSPQNDNVYEFDGQRLHQVVH